MVLTFFQFKTSLRPLNLEEVSKCDLAIKKKKNIDMTMILWHVMPCSFVERHLSFG